MVTTAQSIVNYFYTLFDPEFFTAQVEGFFMVYCVASVGFVLILFLSLRNKFQSSSHVFYLFPLLLSLVMPIFGMLVSAFICISLARCRLKHFQYTETIEDSINLKDVKYSYEHYGAGGAFIHLMKQSESPVARIEALFALAQGQLAGVNPVLQELLPDTSDEIRLLSFNILDQQESLIQKDINHMLMLLENPELDALSRAKFEKNLGLLYWELSYRHLILKELEDTTLNKGLSYALSAQRVLSHDATLFALLGKIYYRLKRYDLAEAALNKAVEYNIPRTHVLPYLAEISYKTKDYAEVRSYLDESNALLDISVIAPVKRYWDTK